MDFSKIVHSEAHLTFPDTLTSPGMLAFTRTKTRPHSPCFPTVCILQDVLTLHKFNLTSSYSFSTTDCKYGDLDYLLCVTQQIFQMDSHCTILSARGRKNPAWFSDSRRNLKGEQAHWVHSCACYRAAISNWVFNFKDNNDLRTATVSHRIHFIYPTAKWPRQIIAMMGFWELWQAVHVLHRILPVVKKPYWCWLFRSYKKNFTMRQKGE